MITAAMARTIVAGGTDATGIMVAATRRSESGTRQRMAPGSGDITPFSSRPVVNRASRDQTGRQRRETPAPCYLVANREGI